MMGRAPPPTYLGSFHLLPLPRFERQRTACLLVPCIGRRPFFPSIVESLASRLPRNSDVGPKIALTIYVISAGTLFLHFGTRLPGSSIAVSNRSSCSGVGHRNTVRIRHGWQQAVLC